MYSADFNKLVLCSPLRPAQRIQATLATMTVTQQQEAAQTDAWETGGSPMRESDTLGCMVMFYHHVWQEPAFQVYAGLFFGLPLAVTSFNRYSRLVEALGRRLCGALVSLYFDDASLTDWRSSQGSAQWAFKTLNELLGTPLAPDKRLANFLEQGMYTRIGCSGLGAIKQRQLSKDRILTPEL